VKPLLNYQQYGLTRSQQEIDSLDLTLTDLVSRMNQMNDSFDTLNKRYLELTELRHVLRETAVFFDEAESKSDAVFRPMDQDSHLLAPDNEFDVVERGGDRTGLGIGY
jgi:V-type H+-transporting ATPase subunit a